MYDNLVNRRFFDYPADEIIFCPITIDSRAARLNQKNPISDSQAIRNGIIIGISVAVNSVLNNGDPAGPFTIAESDLPILMLELRNKNNQIISLLPFNSLGIIPNAVPAGRKINQRMRNFFIENVEPIYSTVYTIDAFGLGAVPALVPLYFHIKNKI